MAIPAASLGHGERVRCEHAEGEVTHRKGKVRIQWISCVDFVGPMNTTLEPGEVVECMHGCVEVQRLDE
jgi:hypothetical protein